MFDEQILEQCEEDEKNARRRTESTPRTFFESDDAMVQKLPPHQLLASFALRLRRAQKMYSAALQAASVHFFRPSCLAAKYAHQTYDYYAVRVLVFAPPRAKTKRCGNLKKAA